MDYVSGHITWITSYLSCFLLGKKEVAYGLSLHHASLVRGGRFGLDWVADLDWIGRPIYFGLSGRFGSEYSGKARKRRNIRYLSSFRNAARRDGSAFQNRELLFREPLVEEQQKPESTST
jgi:hypothetical protein